ncbi:MAG: hypothetical protein MRZ79_09995 [Bacteroidia bacterium]|nr:hypothetical protein [Bacteroidia bacterium]
MSRQICPKTEINVGLHNKQAKLGDLGLFKVVSLGKHSRIHNREGINQHIFPGDYIVAAFGSRYASNQFEGYIPHSLGRSSFDLLGQGGVVGEVASSHSKFRTAGPTKLEFVGFLSSKGKILNTIKININESFHKKPDKLPKIILSLGSGMDSGKTTSAAHLIQGLTRAEKKAGYIKLTGTAYSKDKQLNEDLGAISTLDFSDIGYPSTYMLELEELKSIFWRLISRSLQANPDYLVIEIADGLLQRETHELLADAAFMENITGVLLSVTDSLCAKGALDFLSRLEIYPFAIAGMMTASPLMIRETSSFASQDILTLNELSNPVCIMNKIEALPYWKERKIKKLTA